MAYKKFDDNFNSIIKSLKPIKNKFSRQSLSHDKYFKKSSIESIEKNLNGQKISPESNKGVDNKKTEEAKKKEENIIERFDINIEGTKDTDKVDTSKTTEVKKDWNEIIKEDVQQNKFIIKRITRKSLDKEVNIKKDNNKDNIIVKKMTKIFLIHYKVIIILYLH